MANKISIKSPTRIDLAGGTLDCWPINASLSPVSTINMAIDVYTTCELTPREDQVIKVSSPDLQQTFEFPDFEAAMDSTDEKFNFFKEHIYFWAPETGFELIASSQSPIGGGLGGSSSLSVSIFKAFNQWIGEEIDIIDAVAFCAGIEAKILGMPTGTQDYFPAYQGGLNIIDYLAGQPLVEVDESEKVDFSQNISLFYTGKAHHSGINNWQVIKKFIDQDQQTIDSLHQLRDVANEVRQAIKIKKYERLPTLFDFEFKARTMLAESFCSPEIDKISEIAKSSGALATKICGAGGGGCVFTWSDPDAKSAVDKACTEAGFKQLNIGFV